MPHVIISLSQKGYLHNQTSKTDLTPDNAMLMWTWIYNNQDRIGQLDLSDNQVKLLNLKNKSFMVYNEIKEIDEKVTIRLIEESPEKENYLNVTLEMEDGSIRTVENFFTFEMLENAREI